MAATPKPIRKKIKKLAKVHREFGEVFEGKKTPSKKAMKVAKSHFDKN